MLRSLPATGLSLIFGLLIHCTQAPAQNAADPAELFEKKIRPLLLEKCIECHGPTKQEHQVRLDRRSDVLSGSASEIPLVVPGKPQDSRLWQVLQHAENDIRMPSTGKL
ncbi:MAG: c-type cytochrome domain-containing protein, partial [Planctomycetaceae bacterium]